MAGEKASLCIKTEEDSCSSEWSPVIVVVKKEYPDYEPPLDSELILKDEDEDSLSVEDILESLGNKEDRSKVSEQPRGHPIYQHFDVLNRNDKKRRSAACHYCSQILKTPFSTTTTLTNHLAAKHGAQYRKYAKIKEQYDAARSQKSGDRTERRSQLAMPDVIQGKRKWPSDYPDAKSLSNKLAKFIVKGLHSVSTVDEPNFREFVTEAQPLFAIPDQKTISGQVPEMYEKCRRNVLKTITEDLQSLPTISISTCRWSARTGHDHYLGVNAHYVDDKFDMINFSLGHQKLAGQHTAINLKSALESKFIEYRLLPSTIPIYVVTDSSPILTAAVNRLHRKYDNLEARSCFANSLKLVITDVKETVIGLNTLCENARGITRYFQRSPDAREALRRAQSRLSLPELEVLQDSLSSWSSEYLMLSRLLQIRVPISSVLSDMDTDVSSFSDSEWDTVKSYVTLLKPLYEATTEINSTTTSTSSLVYFIIWSTKKSWNKYLKGCDGSETRTDSNKLLAKQLVQNLQSRFQNITSDSLSVLAMILDPRFKVSLLAQGDERNRWLKILKAEAAPQPVRDDEVSADSSITPGSSNDEDDSLWAYMKEVAESNNATLLQPAAPIETELDHYLAQKVLPRDAEPLKFWRENCHRYPLLSQLARKYLSVPAVQVATERQNSVTGMIISDRRSSLLPEHVEQLAFLQENL